MFYLAGLADLSQVPVTPQTPLPVTGVVGAGGIVDGGDVTQGAKADAAATDSTSSWTIVALLKGMLAQLLSTAPVQIFANDTYLNITGDTTTTVKSGAGTPRKIVFNKPVATEVITIYDSLSGSGTKIATMTIPASPQISYVEFDVAFATGLTIVTATAASDITVTYR